MIEEIIILSSEDETPASKKATKRNRKVNPNSSKKPKEKKAPAKKNTPSNSLPINIPISQPNEIIDLNSDPDPWPTEILHSPKNIIKLKTVLPSKSSVNQRSETYLPGFFTLENSTLKGLSESKYTYPQMHNSYALPATSNEENVFNLIENNVYKSDLISTKGEEANNLNNSENGLVFLDTLNHDHAFSSNESIANNASFDKLNTNPPDKKAQNKLHSLNIKSVPKRKIPSQDDVFLPVIDDFFAYDALEQFDYDEELKKLEEEREVVARQKTLSEFEKEATGITIPIATSSGLNFSTLKKTSPKKQKQVNFSQTINNVGGESAPDSNLDVKDEFQHLLDLANAAMGECHRHDSEMFEILSTEINSKYENFVPKTYKAPAKAKCTITCIFQEAFFGPEGEPVFSDYNKSAIFELNLHSVIEGVYQKVAEQRRIPRGNFKIEYNNLLLTTKNTPLELGIRPNDKVDFHAYSLEEYEKVKVQRKAEAGKRAEDSKLDPEIRSVMKNFKSVDELYTILFIQVKGSRKKERFEVAGYKKIKDLLDAIRLRLNIPEDERVELFCDGEILEQDKTFDEYDFIDEETLDLHRNLSTKD